jgi:dCTP deaminase
MGVVPFSESSPHPSVVFDQDHFDRNGAAVLIVNPDMRQFANTETGCNVSYDLRVGDKYKDHRNDIIHALKGEDYIELRPGNAVIIETKEDVRFPRGLFGQILPRVSLLARGIANTPSKIDPGYSGHLLITTFNHGKRTQKLQRGERFCSLHLLTVGEGIRPFHGSAKQLEGLSRFGALRRSGDWLEENQIWMTFGVFAFTVVSVILSVVAILR